MIFYVHGIFSNEVFHHLIYGGLDGGCLTFDYGFSPADNTFVGLNF